jgi:hypothetical protein
MCMPMESMVNSWMRLSWAEPRILSTVMPRLISLSTSATTHDEGHGGDHAHDDGPPPERRVSSTRSTAAPDSTSA